MRIRTTKCKQKIRSSILIDSGSLFRDVRTSSMYLIFLNTFIEHLLIHHTVLKYENI